MADGRRDHSEREKRIINIKRKKRININRMSIQRISIKRINIKRNKNTEHGESKRINSSSLTNSNFSFLKNPSCEKKTDRKKDSKESCTYLSEEKKSVREVREVEDRTANYIFQTTSPGKKPLPLAISSLAKREIREVHLTA